MSDQTLLLFPTELERRQFEDHGELPKALVCELCGFGPIAAAARTAELIARRRPARVVLIGIAGAYDVAAQSVGTALEFDDVAIEGIGVGEGRGLIAPSALGFPQWAGEGPAHSNAIFDVLTLDSDRSAETPRLLLTVCAASADRLQASRRHECFPGAIAEDMEGFAVATACALGRVPLRIVRGISNLAGDRAPENWRISAAIAAARAFVIEQLAST